MLLDARPDGLSPLPAVKVPLAKGHDEIRAVLLLFNLLYAS